MLRVPENRQPLQRQTVVQSNQVIQQRPSLQNIRPLSPVQRIIQQPVVSNGTRLFQHLNRNQTQTQTKTITAINSETVQKIEKPTTSVIEQPVITKNEGARVELIHGGTAAVSKLHIHIHEGKTIVQNATATGNAQGSDRVVIQSQSQPQIQVQPQTQTTTFVNTSVQQAPVIQA